MEDSNQLNQDSNQSNQLNVLFAETEAVKIDKKIKECEYNNLFNFIVSHFMVFFLDLEELKKFISFLYDQKKEMLINEMLKDFSSIIKEFRQ